MKKAVWALQNRPEKPDVLHENVNFFRTWKKGSMSAKTVKERDEQDW